jgi:hypothetical protein
MIGKKIRSIRKSKNMTIVELAEKINVTSGYISQLPFLHYPIISLPVQYPSSPSPNCK